MVRKLLTQIYGALSWRLLVRAVLIVAFAWFGDFVRGGRTEGFDDAVRAYVHNWASPGLTSYFTFASFVGSPLFLAILAVIVLAIFLRLKFRREAAFFLITMAGELIIDFSLKLLYARERPEALFDYPVPSSYSFPSGHSFGSMCFFGILAWGVCRRLENNGLRIAVCVIAGILIVSIGLSRVYLGVHYPTDVMAGFAGGLIWLGIVLNQRDRQIRRSVEN